MIHEFNHAYLFINKRAKMALDHSPESLTWEDHSHFFFVPFREEFTRISSCPYSASSPHSLMPCLLIDQNFRNNFLKGSPKEKFLWNYFKIWPADSEKIFYEFPNVHVKQEVPIHKSHVFWPIEILLTIFEKGHPRNIPIKLFQNWTKVSIEETFLKNCLKYSISLPWLPAFLMESNSVNNI